MEGFGGEARGVLKRRLTGAASQGLREAEPVGSVQADRRDARQERSGVSLGIVVQKYGGSSVATAEHIRAVAERVGRARGSGLDLVVVVSAMGKTTDRLLRLAGEVSRDPSPREIDQLLATGEEQSVALLAMALHDMGVAAVSLTGPQAGMTVTGRYGSGVISEIRPERDPQASGRRPGRYRRRFSGDELFGRRHDARARRIGHDGRGARGGYQGGAVRDLHRRGRRLYRRPPHSEERRAVYP